MRKTDFQIEKQTFRLISHAPRDWELLHVQTDGRVVTVKRGPLGGFWDEVCRLIDDGHTFDNSTNPPASAGAPATASAPQHADASPTPDAPATTSEDTP